MSRFVLFALFVSCAAAILGLPLASIPQWQSPAATPSIATSPLPTPTSTATAEASAAATFLLVGIVVGLILGAAVVLIVRRTAPNER
ncbi:MAG TPA: hypothetical protein VJ793_12905 [Anaerolineae bacterium]|nr:hypothetical protein [Anaerolineae bacterium]